MLKDILSKSSKLNRGLDEDKVKTLYILCNDEVSKQFKEELLNTDYVYNTDNKTIIWEARFFKNEIYHHFVMIVHNKIKETVLLTKLK